MIKISKLFFYCLITSYVLGCGDLRHSKSNETKPLPPPPPSKILIPYNPDSPYAKSIQGRFQGLTLIGDTPLISSDGHTPSVAEIMDRVFVLEPWMGERFKESLSKMPEEIFQALGNIKFILIDESFFTSYAWPSIQSIVINPDLLWLTEEEKNTFQEIEDSRNESRKNFSFEARYSCWKGDSCIMGCGNGQPKSLDKITTRLGFFIFYLISGLKDDVIKEKNISAKLQPVGSPFMYSLAQSYLNEKAATLEETNFSAENLAKEFEKSLATSFYDFLNKKTNLAIQTSEILSLTKLNLSCGTMIFSRPTKGFDLPKQTPLVWGQMRRILKPEIMNQALSNITELFPEKNIDEYRKQLEKWSLETIQPGTIINTKN